MDYRQRILDALPGDAFIGLTLSGARGEKPRWVRVRVRSVSVQGQRRLQFSYFDGKKDVAKNVAPAEAAGLAGELLALPFSHVEMQSTAGDLHVRVTKKGRVLASEGAASRPEAPPLDHDRAKPRLLAEDDPLWQALGLAGRDGRILPRARGKYVQVSEFLRLLDEALIEADLVGKSSSLLDAGCGSATLTFAAARHVPGARMMGVDSNADLIAKCSALARSMGAGNIEFRVSRIADFQPETPPDVVLSLHACDIATDEAIARAVAWQARVILAAPCCQHELHDKIGTVTGFPGAEGAEPGNRVMSPISLHMSVFAPVLRQGLLRERLADVLTDAFRAQALKVMGWRVQAVKFVEPEHTAKNLLLRAVRVRAPGHPEAAAEYRALRDFWHVTPAIERLLGEPFQRHIAGTK